MRRPETYLTQSILEPVDENNDDDDLIQVGNTSPQNAYPTTPRLKEDRNRS